MSGLQVKRWKGFLFLTASYPDSLRNVKAKLHSLQLSFVNQESQFYMLDPTYIHSHATNLFTNFACNNAYETWEDVNFQNFTSGDITRKRKQEEAWSEFQIQDFCSATY